MRIKIGFKTNIGVESGGLNDLFVRIVQATWRKIHLKSSLGGSDQGY